MSSIAGQIGSFALSSTGTVLSWGSWATLKSISLAGWGIQASAEYVYDNGPSALSYCWDKVSKYGGPVASTGLQFAGSAFSSIQANISPELLAVVGIVVGVSAGVLGGVALCAYKIRRGFSLREKVVYSGILLEGGSRLVAGKGVITESVKIIPQVLTEKLIGNVGVVSLGAFCAYRAVTANSPQTRAMCAATAVAIAYLLLN